MQYIVEDVKLDNNDVYNPGRVVFYVRDLKKGTRSMAYFLKRERAEKIAKRLNDALVSN